MRRRSTTTTTTIHGAATAACSLHFAGDFQIATANINPRLQKERLKKVENSRVWGEWKCAPLVRTETLDYREREREREREILEREREGSCTVTRAESGGL